MDRWRMKPGVGKDLPPHTTMEIGWINPRPDGPWPRVQRPEWDAIAMVCNGDEICAR